VNAVRASISGRLRPVSALFAVLFIAIHAEPLSQPWWYADDIVRNAERSEWWTRGLLNGRPLESFWFLTFNLDRLHEGAKWNVALRLVQAGCHILNSVLIMALLRQVTTWRASILSGAWFLLWCFNTEATLWRSGAPYVLSATLSLVGLLLCECDVKEERMVRVFAVLLAASSMLLNQSGAMAGASLFALLTGLRHADTGSLLGQQVRRASPLIVGYLIGGLTSMGIAFSEADSRAHLSGNLTDKLSLWGQLQLYFWGFPNEYPGILIVIHLAFAGLSLLSVSLQRQGRLGSILTVIAGSILPFFALFIVRENTISLRVLYLAPLCAGYLLAAGDRGFHFHLRRGLVGCAVLSVLATAWIGHSQSREYVSVYERDKALVQELERQARRDNAAGIVVVPPRLAEPLVFWNPLGLRHPLLSSHSSAFWIPWATETWLRSLTQIPSHSSADALAAAVSWCEVQPRRVPYVISAPLPETRDIVFCPR
jgi:hypothetical protein